MPTVHILLLLLLGAAVNSVTALAQGRLLDGKPADVGSHPYSVSVQRDGTHICGGALISSKVILTAAHSLTSGGTVSYPPRSFIVRAGSIQRVAGGQLALVEKIVVHSEFAKELNNVALIVLQQALTLNANTQPIALATELPPAGSDITFTGWGAIANQGASSQRMLVGSRKTISAADCQKLLFLDHAGLLCLVPDTETAVSGICHNDAGAPAVYNNQLVGIGTFFVDVCGSSMPNGFMSVPYYREWINQNM